MTSRDLQVTGVKYALGLAHRSWMAPLAYHAKRCWFRSLGGLYAASVRWIDMTRNGDFVVFTGELDVDTLPQTAHTEHPVHPWYVLGDIGAYCVQ